MKSMLRLILILPALIFSFVHAEEIFFLHCQYNLHGDVGCDIESADFNNDEIIDFIATSDSISAGGGCGWYEVFLGNGNGTFTRMGSQYVGESQEHWEWNLLTGDFNEDLNEDFLVMNNEESILYTGNGDGTFTETSTFPWKVHNGCAVDFNCDGHLDVSGANSSRLPSFPDSIKVLLGDGTGNFILSWFTVYYNPFSCKSADFNKDGFPDLVIPGYDYGFSVCFGAGDGSFGEQEFYDPANESYPCYSTCADFNEDGFTDIAVTGDAGMSIPSTFIYLNQQDETFIKTDELFIGECATDINASDINLDTHLDLAVSGWFVGITPGYGNGTFSHDYEDYLHYDLGSRFILKDLVCDGDIDIVTIHPYHNDCKIFLNTANPLGCEEEVFQPLSVPVISTWPNPFSGSVTIQLEDTDDPSGLLHVCDISGRLVRELQCAGEEGTVTWNGRDVDGCELPSGLYVIRYNSGATAVSSRLLKL